MGSAAAEQWTRLAAPRAVRPASCRRLGGHQLQPWCHGSFGAVLSKGEAAAREGSSSGGGVGAAPYQRGVAWRCGGRAGHHGAAAGTAAACTSRPSSCSTSPPVRKCLGQVVCADGVSPCCVVVCCCGRRGVPGRRACVRAAKVKAHELRSKGKQDLLTQLKDLKSELAALRVAKVTGGAPNKLSKIKVVRKSIARVLTVFRQNQRAALKKKIEDDHQGKKGKVRQRGWGAEAAGVGEARRQAPWGRGARGVGCRGGRGGGWVCWQVAGCRGCVQLARSGERGPKGKGRRAQWGSWLLGKAPGGGLGTWECRGSHLGGTWLLWKREGQAVWQYGCTASCVYAWIVCWLYGDADGTCLPVPAACVGVGVGHPQAMCCAVVRARLCTLCACEKGLRWAVQLRCSTGAWVVAGCCFGAQMPAVISFWCVPWRCVCVVLRRPSCPWTCVPRRPVRSAGV